MKKNLKSKILLCVLAGGVLAANTVMAEEYTETITEDITLNNGDIVKVDDIGIDSSNKELTVIVNGEASIIADNKDNDVIGIKGNNNNIFVLEPDDAKLNITVNGGKKAVGIDIFNVSDTIINSDLDIKVENNKDYGHVYGIYTGRCKQTFNGDIDIDVKSNYNSDFSAIATSGDSNMEFNGKINATINSDKDIDMESTQYDVAAGIAAGYSTNMIFNDSVNLTIKANSNSTPVAGIASVISYNNENIITFNDVAKISVDNKSGEAVGVVCAGSLTYNEGLDAIVNFRNNVFIDTNGITSIAILAKDDSIVDVSKKELSIAKDDAVHGVIIGDVQAEGIEYGNRGYVNLNLTGKDSLIKGDIHTGDDGSVTSLALHDGAVWKPTGTMGDSLVSDLYMDNGVIEQNTGTKIEIQQYSGTGNINFTAEDTDVDGVADFNNIGDVTIKNAEKDSFVELGITHDSINTLDIAKTEENLNAVANKLYYDANDGNLNGKVVIKEGFITPEASGDLLFDTNDRGYVTNITGGDRTTETMYAMKNLAATAIVAWRQEDSTLSQRLGELRDSADGQGIWVRMSRGEFEYDGEYKNQYNFFQMGYDWAADDWHYGAAISHNDGQTTYTYGDGENRSTSLSLYGTWLGDKGHYADIVLKQGHLSNDFDIYTSAGHTSGDYDAWGTSLSGEYGKKIALEDDWYVTPQAQLTLMRIGGEDYTTNNGINVHQDTLHSAVGRLGFELGKKIDDKGSVYAKASLLHDFAGNAETYLSYKGFANSYSQDLSDTWCEAGIGFNYKTSDNSYVYADVVKTFGGDVETPWQWNAGMRWSF